MRVMLPLDTLDPATGLLRERTAALLASRLRLLAAAGVAGVSLDAWWGLLEPAPRVFNFAGVVAVVRIARDCGLATSVIASFHACGCGPGDDVSVPLPKWALNAAAEARALCEGVDGARSFAALSPGADAVPLCGRTPPQIVRDFVEALSDALRREGLFGAESGGVAELHVGLGPCGELRWPAYDPPLRCSEEYPGSGAFMCYDPHCAADAKSHGVLLPEKEVCAGPADEPERWPLFCEPLASSARFSRFKAWYGELLVAHGARLLAAAKEGLGGNAKDVAVCAKIAGVHWLHDAPVRAAEITAGYVSYDAIATMLSEAGVRCIFTCLEKQASSEPASARSNPEALVREVREACARNRVPGLDAENAHFCLDAAAFDRIAEHCAAGDIGCFTFLRLKPELVGEEDENAMISATLNAWIPVAAAGGITAAALAALSSRRGRLSKMAFASALLILCVAVAKAVKRSFGRPAGVPPVFSDFVARLRNI